MYGGSWFQFPFATQRFCWVRLLYHIIPFITNKTLYGYFRRNRSRHDRYWSNEDLSDYRDVYIENFWSRLTTYVVRWRAKKSTKDCVARSSYLPVAFKFFVSVVVIVVVIALTRKTILDMRPFYGKRAMKTTSLVTHREAQKCYLTSKVFLTINSTSVKVMHL